MIAPTFKFYFRPVEQPICCILSMRDWINDAMMKIRDDLAKIDFVESEGVTDSSSHRKLHQQMMHRKVACLEPIES
jgi:hypothetical protein